MRRTASAVGLALLVLAGVLPVGPGLVTPAQAGIADLPAPNGGPWRGWAEWRETGTLEEANDYDEVSCSWAIRDRIHTAGRQTANENSYGDGGSYMEWLDGPYTYWTSGSGRCDERHRDFTGGGWCSRSYSWSWSRGSVEPVSPGNTGGFYAAVSIPPPEQEGPGPSFGGGARWAWESESAKNVGTDTCSHDVAWATAEYKSLPTLGLQVCPTAWTASDTLPPPLGTTVGGTWDSRAGAWTGGPVSDDPLDTAEHCVPEDYPDYPEWSSVLQSDWEFTYVGDTDPPPEEPPPSNEDTDCGELPSGLNTCWLEPGDILVWRGGDPSYIETEFGDTFWTHAAMVLGWMELDGQPGREMAIADALPHVQYEVAIRDIVGTEFGVAHAPGQDVAGVAAYRLNLPRTVRTAAAEQLTDHLLTQGEAAFNVVGGTWWAKEFSYPTIGPTPAPDPTARGPSRFYCSSLVWWAYKAVGHEIEGLGDWDFLLEGPFYLVDTAYVTPDDLLENQYGAIFVDGDITGGEGFGAYSPVHVMLTDGQGRRAGKAPDGTVYEEIPGALWVETAHNESVTVPASRPGWTVTLSGYDYGEYTLLHRTVDGGAFSAVDLPGFTQPGTVETFRVGDLLALAADVDPVRMAGADRYATAVDLSRRTAPSDAVVMATGLNYPDALSAAPLAAALSSPLLLTHTASLGDQVRAEIERRAPSTVYVIGGTAAISDAVETALASIGSVSEVIRLEGANRYATSRRVAEVVRSLPGAGDEEYLVSGENFPDAVAVSALASLQQRPIVLTPPTVAHPDTLAALAASEGPATVVGGTAAVTDEALAEYRAQGATVHTQRIAGRDRYATSAQVAQRFSSASDTPFERVWLATAQNFPDALSAGPAAAAHLASLLLSPSATLADATRARLAGACEDGLAAVMLVGGDAALSPTVLAQADEFLDGACA